MSVHKDSIFFHISTESSSTSAVSSSENSRTEAEVTRHDFFSTKYPTSWFNSRLTPSRRPQSRGFPNAFCPCATEFSMIFMNLITARKMWFLGTASFFAFSGFFSLFFTLFFRVRFEKNFLLLGLLGSLQLRRTFHFSFLSFFFVFIYSRICVLQGALNVTLNAYP